VHVGVTVSPPLRDARAVEIKRIRNGEHQTLETLINEEAQLFAKSQKRGD